MLLNEELLQRAEELNTILEERGASFKIRFEEVPKNNVVLQGYVLASKERNCCPIVYLNEDIMQMDNLLLVGYLEKIYEENVLDIDVSSFYNKEYILKNILPRLVSASNVTWLQEKESAYMPFLDMLIAFYVPIDVTEDNKDNASFSVTTACLEKNGISLEEAFFHAKINLERQIEFISMEQMMKEIVGKSGIDTEESCLTPDKMMLVITNYSRIYGASAMLSETVRDRLRKLYGEQFVILPSSVHECIVVGFKDAEDLQTYYEMVCEINGYMVKPEEKLTDNVYVFEDNTLRAVF